MKAILISIQPKWTEKILNGEKTIEIRKTLPKCDLPIDVYIYCTKGEPYLYKDYDENVTGDKVFTDIEKPLPNEEQYLGGKIVAKFTLKKVDELRPFFHWCKELEKATCLTRDKILDYLDSKDKSIGNPKRQDKVYAWRIDNLEIFDKPKELSEFKSYKKNIVNTKINGMVFETELDNSLIKAPQSMMYIEVDE